MAEKQPEHEYVDLLLDMRDGKVVSCELYGEGRQVEPLVEPVLLRFIDGQQWPRGADRIQRMIRRAFRQRGL